MSKINEYKVFYSRNSSATVNSKSVRGARGRAWRMLGGFKHGWTRSDFMRSATVKKLN